MQVDLFCNRESRKVVKGDILDMKIQDDNSPTPIPHICITLNTGYNLMIEAYTLAQIKKFMDENMEGWDNCE